MWLANITYYTTTLIFISSWSVDKEYEFSYCNIPIEQHRPYEASLLHHFSHIEKITKLLSYKVYMGS